MVILITGGTGGYIGSHTCVELLQEGHSVVIMDNLANSERCVVDRIQKNHRQAAFVLRGGRCG